MKIESAGTSNSRRGIVRWAVISAIVLFLLMLVIPAPIAGPRHSEKTFAQNTAYNLKNAISTYYTEYRRYPVNVRVADAVVDSDHELMDILMGSEDSMRQGGLNPRGISFYTGKRAKSMGQSRYRKGITPDKNGGGELWDPWGNYYRIQVDADFDNSVDDPETPHMDRPGLPQSILVWSAGPDGNFDTWKDNPRTW